MSKFGGAELPARDVLYFEPYPIGSHQAIAHGYQNHSRNQIRLVTGPGDGKWTDNYFAGAEILEDALTTTHKTPYIVVVTDLFPLADACMRFPKLGGTQVPLLLMHLEHQLAWPVDKKDESRYITLPFASAASILASSISAFQSQYSLSSYLKGIKAFLSDDLFQRVVLKCRMIPAGVDLASLLPQRTKRRGDVTTILFNHRCDKDKNYAEFFEAAIVLKNQGFNFRLIITGLPTNTVVPADIQQYMTHLQGHIEHFGMVESRRDYADLLWQSDIVVSTSNQEYFGISVIEAMFCGCFPILPHRLTYPEIIPPAFHRRHLYSSLDELIDMLKFSIEHRTRLASMTLSKDVEKYDWKRIAPIWDDLLEEVAQMH